MEGDGDALADKDKSHKPLMRKEKPLSRYWVCGLLNGGDVIRTRDLQVMSLASYRAAPPRGRELIVAEYLEIVKANFGSGSV